MEKKKFDIAVLGGGVGGYPAAIRAAQLGKSVALIEAGDLGGTCLNRGCIPSKALIAGSEMVEQVKKAPTFGIDLTLNSVNYEKLTHHKDSVVERMRKGLEGLIASNNITVIRGYGKFVDRNTIKVQGQDNLLVEADKIIIATGSEPRQIPAFPFDYKRIHDSTSLLAMKTLPKTLAIIGGGVIGCEFASLYANLGVKVIVLELLPRILSTESEEVSQAITKAFQKKGILVETGIKVQSIKASDTNVTITADKQTYEADICLVAVGRALNTKNITLEALGIQLNDNGTIPVDEHMQTVLEGIYAVGDIASIYWLAHVASHQGLVAANHACGRQSHMSYQAVPSVIFTHPEVGSVGLSLAEAQKRGYKAKVGAFPFQALGKSQATLDADGFAQIVIDEKTGQVLGAQVVGYEAATLVAEMALAITNELTVECIAETIHAHPTIAEAWLESALLAEGLPLHYPPAKKPKRAAG